jgi:hypothetical protein
MSDIFEIETAAVAADEAAEAAEGLSADAAAEVENDSLADFLKFAKPYVFEGKTYDGIDIAPLAEITANDMVIVGRIVTKQLTVLGVTNPLLEMSLDYAIYMTARKCGLPVEFFKNLPGAEAMKLKNAVSNFIISGD